MGEEISGKCSLRREQSEERKKRFLEHLSVSGNISEAGRVAEVRRSTLYLWKETDQDFSSRWEDALEEAADALEAEARRRAVEGYDEPITYAGRVVCDPDTGNPIVRKRYSDGLMAFLLRAHRPSRFRAGMEADGRSGVISINISSDDSAL